MTSAAEVHDRVCRFYANDSVRARIVEFLGGTFLDEATCAYILGSTAVEHPATAPCSAEALPEFLAQGYDIARSLWDRERLIAHVDIEYVNPEFPGEAYLDPHRVFRLQRSVAHAIERILLGSGIAPLHQVTGRGHHFVWSIGRRSSAYAQLARLGDVSDDLMRLYDRPHPPGGHAVEPDMARAFAGLGLVMEYLGSRVKQAAEPDTPIPIQITDVVVGCGDHGREAISIDVSEYADPLHTRYIRIPFSAYLKPQRMRACIGEHVVEDMPEIIQIPLFEMTDLEAIDVMRSADESAELAGRASARIPDQSQPTEALIRDYQTSAWAPFHRWFYEQSPHPPGLWPETYDRLSMDRLPMCVRPVLQCPNDLLLKPACIQLLVRVLMSLGWHPRHIAGLIRSKYERDFGWGDRWFQYNAASRADGYTRLFAGQIATGDD